MLEMYGRANTVIDNSFIFDDSNRMFYSYSEIRSKGDVVEYAIYSYNEDGSFDDVENIVCLSKLTDVSIEEYIRTHYGLLLNDVE